MQFANSQKRGKRFKELIFQNNMEARQRAAEIGADRVVNGTIGSLLENGNLFTFSMVDDLIPKLDWKRISAYAPISGLPAYLEAMETLCFQGFDPGLPISSVAVTGGLGGIRQAVINYTEPGDTVITSDWHWGPYDTIAEDNGRMLAFFDLFDGDRFNHASFQNTVNRISQSQSTLFLLINSPAHNPTGYSIGSDDWDRIIRFLNSVDRKIILFLDVAYIEFAGAEQKTLFTRLKELDDHVFSIINYSISKGLAKYGLRTAALFGLHRDDEVRNEFFNILSISNRGTSGSVPSLGQYLTAALVNDKERFKAYVQERTRIAGLLRTRSETFLSQIRTGLAVPYESGFFISIRSPEPARHVETLKKQNIFLVPLTMGIRVAICSIEKENLSRVAVTLNTILP